MTNPAFREVQSWLLSRLEFDGDWATLHIPTFLERGIRQGFTRQRVKRVLVSWMVDHQDYVAPVAVSYRMAAWVQEGRRLAPYAKHPDGRIISAVKVYRCFTERMAQASEVEEQQLDPVRYSSYGKPLDGHEDRCAPGDRLNPVVKGPKTLHWVRLSKRETRRLVESVLEEDRFACVEIRGLEDGSGGIVVDMVDVDGGSP